MAPGDGVTSLEERPRRPSDETYVTTYGATDKRREETRGEKKRDTKMRRFR